MLFIIPLTGARPLANSNDLTTPFDIVDPESQKDKTTTQLTRKNLSLFFSFDYMKHKRVVDNTCFSLCVLLVLGALFGSIYGMDFQSLAAVCQSLCGKDFTYDPNEERCVSNGTVCEDFDQYIDRNHQSPSMVLR